MVLNTLEPNKNLVVLTSSNIDNLQAFTNMCLKEEYVDNIDSGFLQSNLSIEEYLVFYGIANSVYGNQFVNDIKNYIQEHELSDYYEEPMCNLTWKQKILVRLFITKQKRAQIVLIDNMEGNLYDGDLYAVLKYMRALTKQIGIRCIVTTKRSPMIERYKGALYWL